MIRLGTFVWLAVLTLIGVGLYQVELGVLAKEAQLNEINHRIDANRDAMHVLEAEWSYLNDPTRLADLTRRYTDLTAMTPTQIAGFDRLLPRPPEVAPGYADTIHGPPPLFSKFAPPTPLPPRIASTQPTASGAGTIMAAAKTQSSNQPTDEQAAADDVINAILSDMRKAQQQ